MCPILQYQSTAKKIINSLNLQIGCSIIICLLFKQTWYYYDHKNMFNTLFNKLQFDKICKANSYKDITFWNVRS